MSTPDVRIVTLPTIHVASTYGFGASPEDLAWKKMAEYVKQTGIERDGKPHRYFGFNNPSPAPGSPNYGYEQWVTVEPGAEPKADAAVKTFEGGLYAVLRCRLNVIGESWQQLVAWRESSPYRQGSHQWLEESLNPPIRDGEVLIDPETAEFDLYMPIAE